MIQNFDRSYPAIKAGFPLHAVLGPDAVAQEPQLARAVSVVDRLLPIIGHEFPSVAGTWGLARDARDFAEVQVTAGTCEILIYTGALDALEGDLEALAAAQWIETALYPRLFPDGAPTRLATTLPYPLIAVLGLATLVGHEVGHAVDACDVPAPNDGTPTVLVAEEISADGHGIRVGLAVAMLWAMDQEAQGQAPRDDALRVGCALMLLSNAQLDRQMTLSASWVPAIGATHPPGFQRLFGTAVTLMDRLEERGIAAEVAVEALLATFSALVALGRCPPLDDEALVEYLADCLQKHRKVVGKQYKALQAVLHQRAKVRPTAGRGRMAHADD